LCLWLNPHYEDIWGDYKYMTFLVFELGEGLLHATSALSPEKMFGVYVDTRDIADTMWKGKISAIVGYTATGARSSRP
jgi:hypothetical protein